MNHHIGFKRNEYNGPGLVIRMNPLHNKRHGFLRMVHDTKGEKTPPVTFHIVKDKM